MIGKVKLDYEVFIKQAGSDYVLKLQRASSPLMERPLFRSFNEFVPTGRLDVVAIGNRTGCDQFFSQEPLSPEERPATMNSFLVVCRDSPENYLVQGFYIPSIAAEGEYKGKLLAINSSGDISKPVELKDMFSGWTKKVEPRELIPFGGLFDMRAKSEGHLVHRILDEKGRIMKKGLRHMNLRNFERTNSMLITDCSSQIEGQQFNLVIYGHF